MKNVLKLMRVKHWLKNGLVFIPMFFNLTFLNIDFLKRGIVAFFVFSFVSSIVYIMNDICDVEEDKKHPIKKNRPLASGAISISKAIGIMCFFIVISLLLIRYLYQLSHYAWIIEIPLFYIILNILYSYYFKNVPILDVSVIVFGFVLRVIYGAAATSIVVSKYLYLMIIFGGFYLGFGKRRNEMMKVGAESRKVLNNYTVEFLDKNMYVSYALSMVAYTLWSVDETVTIRSANDYRFWTIPLVMLILQLYSFDIENNSYGDPIDVLLSDKKLLILVVVYILTMLLLLYIV